MKIRVKSNKSIYFSCSEGRESDLDFFMGKKYWFVRKGWIITLEVPLKLPEEATRSADSTVSREPNQWPSILAGSLVLVGVSVSDQFPHYINIQHLFALAHMEKSFHAVFLRHVASSSIDPTFITHMMTSMEFQFNIKSFTYFSNLAYETAII